MEVCNLFTGFVLKRKTALSFQAVQGLWIFFPERKKDFGLLEGEEVPWEGGQNCCMMLELWLEFNI